MNVHLQNRKLIDAIRTETIKMILDKKILSIFIETEE